MLPEAAASALLIPNHAIKIVANARNIRFPIASKRFACSVMSCVKNAKRSVMVLGVAMLLLLRHAPGTDDGAGIGELGVHHRLTFGSKADVIVDGLGFRVALAFGIDGLLFRQSDEQLVRVL